MRIELLHVVCKGLQDGHHLMFDEILHGMFTAGWVASSW
jgi:hypothetical protein